LETLHLLAKLVPEYSHTLDETDVTKHAFDLIFAFDEVIAMGYKERVTLTQVLSFSYPLLLSCPREHPQIVSKN
jgi:hypothetical protein